jgi:hypothetical protein
MPQVVFLLLSILLLAGPAGGDADKAQKDKPDKQNPEMPGVDAAPPGLGSGLKQVGPDTWELSYDEAVQLVASMPFVSRQLWVREVHVKGKFVGYKLKNIKEGSLPHKGGFRNGDIVFRINGMTLKEPLKLLYRILDSTKVVVELERKGKLRKQFYKFVKKAGKQPQKTKSQKLK